jgi:myosin-crossreactive antigen
MTDTSKTSEIYNFSQKKLNSVQCRLLSKGLRFVQTKKNVDIGKHISDLKLWERRMRLREFVYQQNESFDEGNSGNSENCGKTKTQKKSTNTGKKFTREEIGG